MRTSTQPFRRACLSLLPALMLVASGCGEKQLPESAYPGASRDMMEDPVGAAAKLKGAEAEKSKASAKVSAKVKAAREKAAQADPRGK